MEGALERATRLLRRGDELLEKALGVGEEGVRFILLAAAAEAYAAAILASSPRARRREKICEASTKRIISMALMDLRRLQLLSHEEMEELKRVVQALRCKRNHLLHPWDWCLERCREVSIEEAERSVKMLAELARRALRLRGVSIT